MSDNDTANTAEVAEVLRLIERARDEVGRICAAQRDERWRMSIPANPERDSDLIIDAALGAAASLLRQDPSQAAWEDVERVARAALSARPVQAHGTGDGEFSDAVARRTTAIVVEQRDRHRADAERLRRAVDVARGVERAVRGDLTAALARAEAAEGRERALRDRIEALAAEAKGRDFMTATGRQSGGFATTEEVRALLDTPALSAQPVAQEGEEEWGVYYANDTLPRFRSLASEGLARAEARQTSATLVRRTLTRSPWVPVETGGEGR